MIPSPRRDDLLSADGRMQQTMWDDIKGGARYIWHRRPLLWLLGTYMVINFANAPAIMLYPLLVKFNLHDDWAARHLSMESALAVSIPFPASVHWPGRSSSAPGVDSNSGASTRCYLRCSAWGCCWSFWGYPCACMSHRRSSSSSPSPDRLPNPIPRRSGKRRPRMSCRGASFLPAADCAMYLAVGNLLGGLFGGLYNPGHVISILGAFIALFLPAATLQSPSAARG